MEQSELLKYWNEIPVGAANAVSYDYLRLIWQGTERQVRKILQELSYFDNGDNYILIRSGSKRGFYKTDDPAEIAAYKKECLKKGKSLFAPVKKINRILSLNSEQVSFFNNLRLYREQKQMTQQAVCDLMQKHDPNFNKPMLSRIENSICLPTPTQLARLAVIYDCLPSDLIDASLY